MKREDVDNQMAEFPLYADLRLLALPDGWTEIVREVFTDLHELQQLSPGFMACDLPIQMISIDWKLYHSDGYLLYVRPSLHHRKWTGDMALRLVQVVGRFNDSTRQICEVCCEASVGVLKYQDNRRQQRLCQEHMDERRWS